MQGKKQVGQVCETVECWGVEEYTMTIYLCQIADD